MKTLARLFPLVAASTFALAGCNKAAERQDEANVSQPPADIVNAAAPVAEPANEAAAPPAASNASANAAANAAEADSVQEDEPAPAAKTAPKPTPAAAPAATATPATPAAAPAVPPKSFALCTTCHSTGQGEAHRIGPNLFGVVGAKAGARPGFTYSDAMKAAGFSWTRDRLDTFLTAPRDLVPGTKMMIPGVKDAQDRKAIIDYLSTLK